MAVTLIQSPPAFALSGNFIPVKFETTKYFEQLASITINLVTFLGAAVNAGATMTLSYGGKTVAMQAVSWIPDDSGTEFPQGDGSYEYVVSLLPYFQANYQLSKDFIIEVEPYYYPNTQIIKGGRFKFTSRLKNYGYNFSAFSTPLWESFVGQPGWPAIVRSNFGIFFELYCEKEDLSGFELAYSGTLPVNSESLQASIDLSDTLHSLLQAAGYDMPGFASTTPMPCNKTCRRYYFRYAEAYGDPVAVRGIQQSGYFTVILGKLSYVGAVENTLQSLLQPGLPDADRFLKQGSSAAITLPAQPQVLYFFNSRADVYGAKLRVNFFTANDAQPIPKTVVFDCLLKRKYAFNMRFDQIFNAAENPGVTVLRYEAWLETSGGNHISQVVTYTLDYTTQLYVRYFLYLGSWGTIETLPTFGKAEMKYDLTSQEAERTLSNNYSLQQGESVVFDIKTQDSFKVPTGWITKPSLIQIRDFLTAPKKWRYNKGRMLPIALTSKTIEEMEDGNNLYSQSLEYKYLFADDAYTERTNDEPEQSVEAPKILNVYYGPAGAVPNNADAIKGLAYDQSETTYEFTINTGLNRIIIVAIPVTKSLHQVRDVQSGENLTLSYAQVAVLDIDESPYKVIALQNALPYSYNHEHIITLKNG